MQLRTYVQYLNSHGLYIWSLTIDVETIETIAFDLGRGGRARESLRGGANRWNISELASEPGRTFFPAFSFFLFVVLILCTSISSELEPSLKVIIT